MAETSSLNCLSCRIPYQRLHSLNAWILFSEKALLFHDFLLRRIPFPKLRSEFLQPRMFVDEPPKSEPPSPPPQKMHFLLRVVLKEWSY